MYDEEYGFISPDIFIKAAEKSGAIHRLGDFVLKEVFEFIGTEEFEKSGLDYIEINLSVQQCLQANLADNIIDLMDCYKISPDKVNLEITESVAGFSQSVVTNNLLKLNKTGIRFSLDDYGTGYSNIRRLGILPISIVKLDKLFVDEYHNEAIKIIIKHSVNMFKELDLKILVEGVETKEQLDEFIEVGCDYIQGFYYSMPLVAKDLIEFLDSYKEKINEI